MNPPLASPREALPLEYTRQRLAMLVRLIEGSAATEDEQKALAFIVGEELSGLILSLWRASR